MTDESVATLTNLLRDARGPLVEALRWSTPFISEVERESDEVHFDGEKVKVPIIMSPARGTGFGTETGILNQSRTLKHDKVTIDTGIVHHTVGFTSKAVLAASKVGDTGWIDVVPKSMSMAEEAVKRAMNEAFLGNGDALLAAFTAGATSATHTVGTDANFNYLWYGRIVDVLNRTTGATVSLGREIIDFDETAGTVTFDTSITVTTSDGIYLEGSFGNAPAGMGQATAATGTFQTLSKTSTPPWRGVDATPASAQDLTISLLDKAERMAHQRSGSSPTFYIGDPSVIDRFTQGMTVQAHWDGTMGTLKTGWKGVQYLDRLFIKDFDVPARTLFGPHMPDIRLYSRDDGPDWDEKDGSMFKRFARALPYEAWLVWHVQLGFHRCNSQVKIGLLNRAA
jgi:hypothetical protein